MHKRETFSATIPKMGKHIVQQLRDTLTRLIQEGGRYPTLVDLSARCKVSKSTLARARTGESVLRIDNLEDIARAYGLEAWQLLVPHVDPNTPPRLVGDGQQDAEWPFPGIPRAEFDALPLEDRNAIAEYVEMKVNKHRFRARDGSAAA
ncbi:helix-turn-helix transcriptional regulator [Orrella sp. JC864]|uniref:helix-turn-helix domain-containing protein n=1 Tax=Orrella sp. JC864 TaxID=3120298 RepID=UPI0030092F95